MSCNEEEDFSGTVLNNRFKFVGQIGGGSDAQVYYGMDLDTGGEVAIKLVAINEDGASERLIREYEVYQALNEMSCRNGKGAVKVYYSGKCGRYHRALVIALMNETLQEMFERRQYDLSTGHLFALGRQLLDQIELLHSAGYVHGDLHFGNIMLDSKGNIYIIDFGACGIPEKRTRNCKNVKSRRIFSYRDDLLRLYKVFSVYYNRNEDSCGMPKTIQRFRKVVSELGSTERPDYSYLRSCLQDSKPEPVRKEWACHIS